MGILMLSTLYPIYFSAAITQVTLRENLLTLTLFIFRKFFFAFPSSVGSSDNLLFILKIIHLENREQNVVSS